MNTEDTRGPERASALASQQGPEMPSAASSSVRVIGGNPTPDELAAVVAVLQGMAEEVEGTRRTEAAREVSAWVVHQRPIRTPIVPGHTRWRSFG